MANTVALGGNPVEVAGSFPQKGQHAPAFSLVGKDLSDVTLASFAGKRKILNIFPSVDTGVCAASARKFNEAVSALQGVALLNISADLPFAAGRFCESNSLKNVVALSTFRSPDFAKAYGVGIVGGPLAGLTARAVVVLDAGNKVLYTQLVPEIAQEPDYAAALAAVR